MAMEEFEALESKKKKDSRAPVIVDLGDFKPKNSEND